MGAKRGVTACSPLLPPLPCSGLCHFRPCHPVGLTISRPGPWACTASSQLNAPAADLAVQPRNGDPTAVVKGQVLGIVLQIRLPGAGDDLRGQVDIVLLSCGI